MGQVKAVVTANAAGLKASEAELGRLEEALACLGAQKAEQLAAFTLQYIQGCADAGKVSAWSSRYLSLLREVMLVSSM